MDQRRAAQVRGTFDERAFQLSVSRGGGGGKGLEGVAAFDGLGVLCVPHLGTYGDEYEPLPHLVLVGFPCGGDVAGLVGTYGGVLPAALLAALEATGAVADTACELWFCAHPPRAAGPCQHFTCERTDELNVMWHAWALPGARFWGGGAEAVRTTLAAGVFEARGVSPAHQDLKAVGAGVPFGRLGPRDVSLHHQRFSPCNNQLRADAGAEWHSFFAAAVSEDRRRAVVSHHLVPGTPALGERLAAAAHGANTLSELAGALPDVPSRDLLAALVARSQAGGG